MQRFGTAREVQALGQVEEGVQLVLRGTGHNCALRN
jgi:hypothetical protein